MDFVDWLHKVSGRKTESVLYVHRCHKCAKKITPKPTTLVIIEPIVILCSECIEK